MIFRCKALLLRLLVHLHGALALALHLHALVLVDDLLVGVRVVPVVQVPLAVVVQLEVLDVLVRGQVLPRVLRSDLARLFVYCDPWRGEYMANSSVHLRVFYRIPGIR